MGRREGARLRLLVVDDCPEDRALFKRLLRHDPAIEVFEAETAEEAIASCRSEAPDCLLLDFHLPDGDGLDVLTALTIGPGETALPVVMLTGQGSEEVAVQSMRAGAADYLSKHQVSQRALERALTNAIDKHGLRASLRHAREELERTVEDLKRRNEEVRGFYHVLSHELKSPLTAVSEFVALVLEGIAGPLNGEQRELLEIARTNCGALKVHVNDILDQSRLETGKLTLEREPTALAGQVGRVLASLRPAAREAGVALVAAVPEDLPEVLVDRGRVCQVLTNLVGNALKFTPRGGEVAVQARPDGEGIEVAVRDTGRGIPPDQLTLVFERLYQVSRDDTGRGGLGLGLSISRDLVRLHGGRMWADSAPGQGSTFYFTLPAAAAGPLEGAS